MYHVNSHVEVLPVYSKQTCKDVAGRNTYLETQKPVCSCCDSLGGANAHEWQDGGEVSSTRRLCEFTFQETSFSFFADEGYERKL